MKSQKFSKKIQLLSILKLDWTNIEWLETRATIINRYWPNIVKISSNIGQSSNTDPIQIPSKMLLGIGIIGDGEFFQIGI